MPKTLETTTLDEILSTNDGKEIISSDEITFFTGLLDGDIDKVKDVIEKIDLGHCNQILGNVKQRVEFLGGSLLDGASIAHTQHFHVLGIAAAKNNEELVKLLISKNVPVPTTDNSAFLHALHNHNKNILKMIYDGGKYVKITEQTNFIDNVSSEDRLFSSIVKTSPDQIELIRWCVNDFYEGENVYRFLPCTAFHKTTSALEIILDKISDPYEIYSVLSERLAPYFYYDNLKLLLEKHKELLSTKGQTDQEKKRDQKCMDDLLISKARLSGTKKEEIELLIDYGANPQVEHSYDGGGSILDTLVQNNNFEAFKFVLQKTGTIASSHNTAEHNMYWWLEKSRSWMGDDRDKICRHILEKEILKAETKLIRGETVLSLAIKNNRVETTKFCLDEKGARLDDFTAVFNAIVSESIDTVQLFLDRKLIDIRETKTRSFENQYGQAVTLAEPIDMLQCAVLYCSRYYSNKGIVVNSLVRNGADIVGFFQSANANSRNEFVRVLNKENATFLVAMLPEENLRDQAVLLYNESHPEQQLNNVHIAKLIELKDLIEREFVPEKNSKITAEKLAEIVVRDFSNPIRLKEVFGELQKNYDYPNSPEINDPMHHVLSCRDLVNIFSTFYTSYDPLTPGENRDLIILLKDFFHLYTEQDTAQSPDPFFLKENIEVERKEEAVLEAKALSPQQQIKMKLEQKESVEEQHRQETEMELEQKAFYEQKNSRPSSQYQKIYPERTKKDPATKQDEDGSIRLGGFVEKVRTEVGKLGDNPDISQANKVFAERKPPLLPTTSPNKTRRQMNYINPLTREFPTYLNSGIESQCNMVMR